MQYNNPAIAQYCRTYGMNTGAGPDADDPTGDVQSLGFALDVDPAGTTITQITLYNSQANVSSFNDAESVANDGWSQFQDTLPLGVTWDMTSQQIEDHIGSRPASLAGGEGQPIGLIYHTSDGYTVGFWVDGSATNYSQDLNGSEGLMHITVQKGNQAKYS